jgi:hypothetical protein
MHGIECRHVESTQRDFWYRERYQEVILPWCFHHIFFLQAQDFPRHNKPGEAVWMSAAPARFLS